MVGIQTLRPLTVPRSMLAQRMNPDAPPGVAVLGNAPAEIPVQHQGDDGIMHGGATIRAADLPDMQVSGELPPDASVQMVGPEYTQPENGVGTYPEKVVHVPLPPSQLKSVQQAPAQINPNITVKKAGAPSLPAPTQAAVAVGAVKAPPTSTLLKVPTTKVKVKMSNKGMGKLAVTVRAVSVSETCVILAYAPDSENIIEPPVSDMESPILVEHDGKTYTCVFGGWTAVLDGSFLVILIRSEDEEKGGVA